MHQAFEAFVAHELTAYIREDCRQPDIGIGVTGTSLGAFYSANFALKHPETFRYALCMSGRYDISWLTDGYNSDAVYYNNPMAYVPNLEGAELDRVRNNTHLVLVCGRGQWEDGNIEDTEALAEILAQQGHQPPARHVGTRRVPLVELVETPGKASPGGLLAAGALRPRRRRVPPTAVYHPGRWT